jgi:hypothetical protein
VGNPPVNAVNYLLASLPPADRSLVTEACEHTELPFGEALSKPGDTIHHVYFPTHSYISLITPSGSSESLEVGMVGSEGLRDYAPAGRQPVGTARPRSGRWLGAADARDALQATR